MFETVKKLFAKETPKIAPTVKTQKKIPNKTPKELATEQGQPWVNVIGLDVDPSDLNQGAFELDWNDIFVAKLIRAGYQGKTDADIVDQWFQNICRHVVLETFEQDAAMNPTRYTQSRNLGDGRREVS